MAEEKLTVMPQKKVRCLFVLPSLAGGGAEKVTLTLLKNLDRQKFSPTLLLFKPEGEFLSDVPNNIPLITALPIDDKGILSFFKIIHAVRKAAKANDVVVGALELQGILCAVIGATLAGRPSIAWVHKHLGTYLGRRTWVSRALYWLVCALVFSFPKRIVTVSADAAKSLCGLFFWRRKAITFHYNPIDFAAIEIEDKQLARSYLEQPPPRCVLAVGRLTAQKGFDILIQAMSTVVKVIPNAHLSILGEGEQRVLLERMIQDLKLSKNVSLSGFTCPYKAMAETDLFVMSSRYEGLPTVMLEAMYCGAPILSSDCPSGPREILDDGRYGVLVPSESPLALSDAIIALLHDRQRLDELSQLSLSRVKHFAINDICHAWQQELLTIQQDKLCT